MARQAGSSTDDRRLGNEPASTRTVDRALSLLDAVLSSDRPRSLTGLAREVGLSPSTASRLLDTLGHHDLIQRGDDGHFRSGIRIKQLAAAALRDDPLYELSGPHLDALAADTREAASLGVRLGADEVLYLRQVMAPGQLVQAIGWTGRTIPRAKTALGAALDGLLEPEGYAISCRPDNEVDAVAVPITDHSGTTIGALSVSAPRYRTSLDDLRSFGELLRSHGAELSALLGAPATSQRTAPPITVARTNGTPGR